VEDRTLPGTEKPLKRRFRVLGSCCGLGEKMGEKAMGKNRMFYRKKVIVN
jgi:hypothetical protein